LQLVDTFAITALIFIKFALANECREGEKKRNRDGGRKENKK